MYAPFQSHFLTVVVQAPQRISNLKIRCAFLMTQGLSPLMFIFAILGNSTYGTSILLRSTAPDYLFKKLPWLLGSMGTLIFDMTVCIKEFLVDSEDHWAVHCLW
jgi:hypothetical protein